MKPNEKPCGESYVGKEEWMGLRGTLPSKVGLNCIQHPRGTGPSTRAVSVSLTGMLAWRSSLDNVTDDCSLPVRNKTL